MMILITGGSGSGKSAYGEERILSLPGKKRVYLATMIPWDEECKNKIARHRLMRAEKSFETIEKYRDIQEVSIPEHSTVLLECLSNLTANEMFGSGNRGQKEAEAYGETRKKTPEAVGEKIADGVKKINSLADNLVVITNEVFSDGTEYDEETERYRKALGRANCILSEVADEVVEVVWGIPVKLK